MTSINGITWTLEISNDRSHPVNRNNAEIRGTHTHSSVWWIDACDAARSGDIDSATAVLVAAIHKHLSGPMTATIVPCYRKTRKTWMAGDPAGKTVTVIVDPIPVGLTEIASMLGVQRGTVDQWQTRGVLPVVRWTVGGRPAWDRATIEYWAWETGRDRLARDASESDPFKLGPYQPDLRGVS